MSERMTKKPEQGSVLPQLTNRWLGVNAVETKVEQFPASTPFTALTVNGRTVTGQSDVLPASLDATWAESGYGISQALLDANQNEANVRLALTLRDDETQMIHATLSNENPLLVDRTYVHVPTGVEATLVIDVGAADDAALYRNGTLWVDVEEDGLLHLALVHRLNAASVNNFALAFRVADGGAIDLSHVEFVDGTTNYHVAGDLAGVEAAFSEKAGYLAAGSAALDLFYDVRFHGMFTSGVVKADGALFDQSVKRFRGTLDFLEGARGAVGDETETAMLMSDEAKSIAVPLLLCHEEAVEGNHAASAGRLDENLVFYLMSRGLSRREAEAMIVASRIVPTLDAIPDEALREELRQAVYTRMGRRKG